MICLAVAPFADLDQLAGLVTVALGIIGYTALRLATALGHLPNGLPEGPAEIKRVRQQHRLVSRSWLEITTPTETRWLPVYFDPALLELTTSTARVSPRLLRITDGTLYPSGRARDTEPPGRLLDNPARPAPDAPTLATRATRLPRRLLLDAQSAVAAPFAALLWIYVIGGGLPTFACTTLVAAATTTWLAAIRGSDPS
ncbi:hypothetical protein [Nocardia sp. NPDC052566]|uniref:hypothetical protein n=1 Tax=Nocardia sp. NPDC052566 TaxID=3364330 RepID=UPI0037C90B52